MTTTIISGALTTKVTLTTAVYGNPVTIASGATISVASGGALAGTAPTAWTLLNQGVIDSGNSYGVYLHDGGAVTNQSTAAITGFIALDIGGAAATVVNYGDLGSSIAAGNGRGIYLHHGGEITNQSGGTITAAGGAAISALAGTAVPTVVNAGYIGDTGLGVGLYLKQGAVVTNQSGGSIVSHLDAIYIKGAAGTVVNDGRITQAVGTGSGILLLAGGTVTNQPAGTIGGQYGVKITGGAASLVNAGAITGTTDAVLLATGFTDTLTVDPDAAFSGTVDGGNTIGATHTSTLELASAAAAGTLTGLGTTYIDFAQVTIDPGATWTLTGGNPGTGGTFIDAGTLINAGSLGTYVTLLAGAYLLNQATATINGGVVGTGGASQVTNLGSISSNAAGVSLQSGGTVVNGSATDTTALISSNSVGILIDGGGTVDNDGTIIGANFAGIFITGAATIINGSATNTSAVIASGDTGVELRNVATVTNYGTISGGGAFGVVMASGSLTNVGTISGNNAVEIQGGGVVVNTGEIIPSNQPGFGVLIGAGGTVVNGAPTITSASIDNANTGVQIYGSSATVTNYGTIAGTTLNGVYIQPTAVVTNGSTADTIASITGGVRGIYLKGGGVITNDGTVIGTSVAGIFADSATVTNGSSAVTSALIASDATGVELNGILVNYGTIQASGANGRYGVLGAVATLTNFGTISGGFGIGVRSTGIVINDGVIVGNSAASGYAGVAMEAGTLTNAGTIIGAGGQAVTFTFGNALLVVDPGASFGGGTVKALSGASNRLELATGASAGTLTGLGTRYVYFGEITVDAGATWTLASDALAAGYTIADNGTLTNTGSLGSTVTLGAGAVLTNAPSGTIEATIAVVGSFTSPTVVNAGLIDGLSGAGVGVSLSAGGTVINQGSGTIVGAGGTAVAFAGGNALLVVDPGASFGGGIVQAAATASNTLDLASGASAGTLTGLGAQYRNFGTITVEPSATWTLTSDAIGAGYLIYDSGTLTNTGSLGVTVTLGANAVLTNAAGAIINAGRGVAGNAADAAVVNAGAIDGYLTTGVGVFLSAGGTVTNQGIGTISALYGVWSQQAATIVNAGSLYGRDEAVKFHSGYTNLLVVDPGGTFVGKVNGANPIGAPQVSTLELAAGAGTGTLSGLGTQFVDFAQTTIDAGATWTLTGANTIAAGTTLTELSGASLTDTGALENDGTIVLDPSTLAVAGLTGTGSVAIDAGSTLDAQGTIAGGETIMFAGSGAYLHLDNPGSVAGSITNFAVGETIDLKGIDPASVGYADGVLSFAGGSFALSLANPGTVTASASGDGAQVVLCFCTNTLIRTPSGERRVQQLAVGDLVTTHRGMARRIVWIGTGKVLATRGRRTAATPVIVRRGALAKGVPHQDLRVTKGHSLYLDDVLIPVEYLVNHRSIIWDDRAQEIRLYHIELETHDVLLANGAPAESYRDDGNRWLFRNANSGWDRPPLPPCAPVLTGGPVVDAIWRRLLDRAGARPGLPLTDDPDLHLLVDGRRIAGSRRPNGLRVFRLRRRPDEIRVVSRAASPAELGLARDPRVLGVALRRLRLWQAARLRTLDASDPSLIEGFHAFEPDNLFRWTNGDAALPATLFQGIEGPCQVELSLAGAMRYPLLAEAPRHAV